MDNIIITFPDGSKKEFERGITVFQVATSISGRLASEALLAKVDGIERDINFPINDDSKLELFTFKNDEGKHTYWHSTSHIMAHAIKALHPEAKFGVGPAIENGFYYDFDIKTKLSENDLLLIEKKMLELASEDTPFIRRELSKNEALEFFNNVGDQYKVEIISELDENNKVISFYSDGEFTDLCTGPHIPNTSKIKYIKLLSVSGSYWRGDEHREQLQRIYGISFPKKKMLDEYLEKLEEAKKRDHRKLGKELELFHITPDVGLGLPLWLPKGTILRETLEDYLKEEQVKRGYQAVVTPHIGNINLYKTSGHYPYYKDSQFPPLKFENSDEEYLLKPMNCPHHFQIYLAKQRSYRELPLRLAEFGSVYRYEQSGELNGLTRVRNFAVDDSHMFVTHEQLKEELKNVIDLIQVVFAQVGFSDFFTELSFRDDNVDKYGGDISMWERAQKEIKEAADEMNLQYTIQDGEAAFYGPKIDFIVRDILGRKWQLGTVQVDYVMPERFNLEYIGNDGQKHRPIVIHRAPFGSLERFIGILIEHFGGNFPTWLAPIQVAVVPISQNYFEYAEKVTSLFRENKIRVELDKRSEKVGYKIRDWETQKVPYMIVVGEKEKESDQISVRQHLKGDLGSFEIKNFIDKLKNEIEKKIINN